MPPKKNKKRVGTTTKSTSEDVVSSKKSLKRLKKTVSTPEEIVSEKKAVEDEEGGDAEEPVPTPKVKKPCTWLKLDRLDSQHGNKSSLKSPEQDKEAKRTDQARHPKDMKRKRNEKAEEKGHDRQATNEKQAAFSEKKEKEIMNEELSKSKIQKGSMAKGKDATQDTEKMGDESEEELGGMIFMCNAKTKPDCFKYKVMGLPANKEDVVMSIKPGLKFFLYDYELKFMYGVFEASAAGGMKLEPAAFRGRFPAQVRFFVSKNCLPLPESKFKKAIKDSYDETTRKFKMELTVKQVKNLTRMFRPVPSLHPTGKHPTGKYVVPGPTLPSEESLMRQSYLNRYGNSDSHGMFIPLHHENHFSDAPVFHGTYPPRSPPGMYPPRSPPGTYPPRSPPGTYPPRSPPFLTEQEYRSRGLHQGRHLLPATAGDDASRPWELDLQLKHLHRTPASMIIDSAVHHREASRADPSFLSEKDYRTYGLRGAQHLPDIRKNPYSPYDDESTASLVNRYLTQPMTTAESYPNYRNRMRSHSPARAIPDGDRAFAPYSFREHSSVFNERPPELSRGRETDLMSAPVSHRYSFAGPSLSQLR